MRKYKELLKKHGLKDSDIGKMFGYKNPASWWHSTRRPKVIEGVVKLIQKINGEGEE